MDAARRPDGARRGRDDPHRHRPRLHPLRGDLGRRPARRRLARGGGAARHAAARGQDLRRRGRRRAQRPLQRLRLSRRRPDGSRRPRRAGSRGRAPPPRPCAPPCGRGAQRPRAAARRAPSASSAAARSSTRRRPRWTWPSSRPSRGRPERRARARARRVRPTSWSSAAASSEVGAQPRMELRGLAAERRDADRVLEQPAGVAVVAVAPAAGQRAQPPGRVVVEHAADEAREARVGDLRRRGTRGSPRARRRRAGSPARASRDRRPAASTVRTSSCSRPPKRSTRPSTRTASPSAKRLSSSSTSSQTRASIRPLGSTSSSARYGLPPRVVRRSLARDRVDALDDAVLGQLGDRQPVGVECRLARWPTSARSAPSATRGRTARSHGAALRRDRRPRARPSFAPATRTTSST